MATRHPSFAHAVAAVGSAGADDDEVGVRHCALLSDVLVVGLRRSRVGGAVDDVCCGFGSADAPRMMV